MSLDEALGRVLRAYERYYTIEREHAAPPFRAEAVFHQHDERYFLSRSIRLSQSDSQEFVFFATVPVLDAGALARLDAAAWARGLARVTPEWGRKGSDVALVILTERLEAEAAGRIRRMHRSKGYAFSLKGWSNYRLIARELPTGATAHNRLGGSLKEMLDNTLREKETGQ